MTEDKKTTKEEKKKKNIKDAEDNSGDVIAVEAEDTADKNIKDAKTKKRAYIYNTGKRKTAIASVRLYKKGVGEVDINGKKFDEYFKEIYLQEIAVAPLELVTQRKNVNVTVKVNGGGKKGQAESIRNGIAKALLELNPNFRKPLKKAGFLTRDARKKERKKPGLKSARRAPQWRKR